MRLGIVENWETAYWRSWLKRSAVMALKSFCFELLNAWSTSRLANSQESARWRAYNQYSDAVGYLDEGQIATFPLFCHCTTLILKFVNYLGWKKHGRVDWTVSYFLIICLPNLLHDITTSSWMVGPHTEGPNLRGGRGMWGSNWLI